MCGHDFDITGWKVGVRIATRSGGHFAHHLETKFISKTVRGFCIVNNNLHDATRITKIEECNTAVIPTGCHPTSQRDG
jgi:acetoin utilization deacetylase AcuC-like enzyme